MIKKCLFLYFLIVTQVYASSFTIEREKDDDSYESSNANLNLSFFKNYSLSLQYSKSIDDDLESNEISGELSRAWKNSFSVSIGGARREEPSDLIARGGSIGFSYDLNRFWKGDLQTYFSFDYSRMKYQQYLLQERTLFDLDLERDFIQSTYSFILEQELHYSLILGFEYIRFNYTGDAVITVTNRNTSETSLLIYNGALGFPSYSNSIYLIYYPTDYLELELKTAKSTFEDEDSFTETTDFGIYFIYKYFKVGPFYSSTVIKGDDEVQKVGGLSFTYIF